MKRRDILRTAGLAGLGSMVPLNNSLASKSSIIKDQLKAKMLNVNLCVLIPQETEGPYDLDLSNNPDMFRQDVREGNPGIEMNLKFTVVNVNDNCNPIANARVDIWHCNVDGYYSGFNNQVGYLGTKNYFGTTFFRGIQLTDNNGEVNFITIYPGWYVGRVTHIHFQVFLSSMLKATSQTAFEDALTTQVNNTPLYAPHGQNPVKNANDGVFSDMNNTIYQLMTVVENPNGGYDASLIVGIDAPLTGVINLEPETGGQFKLSPVFPNPFIDTATIPFNLTNNAKVTIEIFDLQGRKIGDIFKGKLDAGDHKIKINREFGGQVLASGNYVFQISVENSHGRFMQSKSIKLIEN